MSQSHMLVRCIVEKVTKDTSWIWVTHPYPLQLVILPIRSYTSILLACRVFLRLDPGFASITLSCAPSGPRTVTMPLLSTWEANTEVEK